MIYGVEISMCYPIETRLKHLNRGDTRVDRPAFGLLPDSGSVIPLYIVWKAVGYTVDGTSLPLCSPAGGVTVMLECSRCIRENMDLVILMPLVRTKPNLGYSLSSN
jgi:hypothetical protein